MPKDFWSKCGKLVEVKILDEIGLERYLKVLYENGYVKYTYDLKKDKTRNHKFFLNF